MLPDANSLVLTLLKIDSVKNLLILCEYDLK
jgi:hypothetical protein